jgi:hypothetical protein
MGRGRAKAKQTKVARELKYHVPNTDFSALQRELTDGDSLGARIQQLADDSSSVEEDDGDYADPYATDDEDDGPIHAAR